MDACHRNDDTPLLRELATFLALAANVESPGYPTLAKIYQKKLSVFATEIARVQTFDAREKFWALDSVLDHISTGTAHFRNRIAAESQRTT